MRLRTTWMSARLRAVPQANSVPAAASILVRSTAPPPSPVMMALRAASFSA